jgi:hypothetical protein
MDDARHKGQKETDSTLLELVLQLHGDFRRRLEPIRVTPLQAGVLLFLCRHTGARVTDTAAALGVGLPTLSTVSQPWCASGGSLSVAWLRMPVSCM